MMAMTSQASPKRAIGYFVTALDPIDEIVASTRRLHPSDPLTPLLLLAVLLLETVALEPFQAPDALDRGTVPHYPRERDESCGVRRS
jgi:hypothetical protein